MEFDYSIQKHFLGPLFWTQAKAVKLLIVYKLTMKGIFEKGSPRSSKVRIPMVLMMLKSKDPQGRNHPKHRAQLLQLQPGSCPSRRPRQSWQQVGKIIFNQRLCKIIERLTRISSPGEWDFYDESLSSPRSRLSLKPARNNIDCITGRLVARIWPFG